MKAFLVSSLVIVCTANAVEFPACHDVLHVSEGVIHTISTFPQVDYFTTFNCQGEVLWEIPFGSKIISWKKEADHLFILSKVRNGSAFFLSCIDALQGVVVWEKGIFAPNRVLDQSDDPVSPQGFLE